MPVLVAADFEPGVSESPIMAGMLMAVLRGVRGLRRAHQGLSLSMADTATQ
jgi:hypothetical protein